MALGQGINNWGVGYFKGFTAILLVKMSIYAFLPVSLYTPWLVNQGLGRYFM
jgi:hypothetical protein